MTEEEFLAKLALEKIPVAEILKGLLQVSQSKGAEQAGSWAELLQEELLRRKDRDGLMNVIEFRAMTLGSDAEFRSALIENLTGVSADRLWLALVKHSGISDPSVPVADAVCRLRNLSRLKEGTLCYDGTWGDGIVAGLDDFYGKVTVDFRNKPSHQMSFAYASVSLSCLDDSHILAVKRMDPDALDRLVATDPAGVVKMALASYGPLTAEQLKEKLTGIIVAEDAWKSFWENARKKLKTDPTVAVPAKRNDSIRLLEGEKDSYGQARLESLGAEDDPGKVVEIVSDFSRNIGPGQGDAFRVIAGRKLTEVFRMCLDGGQWRLLGRVLVLTEDLDLAPEGADQASGMFDSILLEEIIAEMSARETSLVVKALARIGREATFRMLVRYIPKLQHRIFREARNLARAGHEQSVLKESVRDLVLQRQGEPEMLCLLLKDVDWTEDELGMRISDICVFAVERLTRRNSGNLTKARNQLMSLFSSVQWMERALARCDGAGKERLLHTITHSGMGSPEEMRSVLARAVKADPSVREFIELDLAGAGGEQATSSAEKPRLTSWRSYNLRREQYRKLVEQDIPANSREIAVARSYGDLRENHEYKAAKEHQAILMRRKHDMELDLEKVQGTDFEGHATDTAGPGTRVLLKRGDGTRAEWCLLGEWDYDQALGILSSDSPLAKKLDGLKKGDKADLPKKSGDSGTEEWVVEDLTGLTGPVRQWIRGEENG